MNVQEFLDSKKVKFQILSHEPTYDAQRMAQAVDVPGRDVAKTVLLRGGENQYIVAVLPAPEHVDLAKAATVLGQAKVELATEIEMGEHCPDCETGALPPFGSQYGMQTLLDESLAAHKELVFESNTHAESIRMSVRDFQELEKPTVGRFILA